MTNMKELSQQHRLVLHDARRKNVKGKTLTLTVIMMVAAVALISWSGIKTFELYLHQSAIRSALGIIGDKPETNIPMNGSVRTRKISRIDKEFPSVETIEAILTEEQSLLANSTGLNKVGKLARTYELVYAIVAAFQREAIPIFVGYGSHLGARRHHGIIPFGEKDVDFQVFSLNEEKIFSIISSLLQSKSSWSNITVDKSDFGFQMMERTHLEHNFSHYIDFWLFDDNISNHIKCIGRNVKHKQWGGTEGCQHHYRTYHARSVPVFKPSDYFPPIYQVFGTHKVPIPRTTQELENWQYKGDAENWNTTCGSHRQWDQKKNKWVQMPKESRACSLLYDKYPFVFQGGNSTEELRQGSVVVHHSDLVM